MVAEKYDLGDGQYFFVANDMLCFFGMNNNYRLKGAEKSTLIAWLQEVMKDDEQAAAAG